MKKYFKTYSLIITFLSILLPITVSASKATCTYNYEQLNVKITYTYEYGVELKSKTDSNTKTLGTSSLNNKSFVNSETGEIFCPKVKISSTTVSKGHWKLSVKKDDNGTSGILNMLVSDDKEKNQPNSNVTKCTYEINAGLHNFSLSWNEKIIYELSENISDYSVDIRNCNEQHFKDGCPNVYDNIIHKAKKLIIDCENKILTDNDQTNDPDKLTNVDTGATTTTNNNDNNNSSKSDVTDIKNAFIGKTSCGGIKNFQFPNALPNITSFAYNLLKIAIPVILIIKGSLDMFKAVSSQKEDEMKKAQKKFTQRLIAGFLSFFVLMIVETVINFIADKTGNNNAMDCVNCFIKGSNYCTKN